MRWLALLLLALLLAPAATGEGAPYVSQHFEVYDTVGAGSEYAAAVADALEEARSALLSSGAALAPPCAGSRYAVYVVDLPSGEGGFTWWKLTFRDGKVVGACVAWINITKGLSSSTLKHVAYHELLHVAQVAYYRSEQVVEAYPWYVEASAEGFASALSGVCGWEPYYFAYELYSSNPYSYSGSSAQCYALSAFYYWVLKSGYASVDEALSGSLSGASAVSGWVNEAYARFLLGLARGLTICGAGYAPQFTEVRLPAGTWSVDVELQGLSAAYFRVVLPAPGTVLISADGGFASNLLLNAPFRVENATLLLALVNPSLNPVRGRLSIYYEPPLEVRVVNGTFDPWGARLELVLNLVYAGRPVEGTVYINGTPVLASSGYARASFEGLGWGVYTIAAQYAGKTAYAKVRVSQPYAALETPSPLYLSRNGRGELVILLRNGGDVAVRARARAGAPPFLEVASADAVVPPGESRLSLGFRATGAVEPADCKLEVCFGSSCLALPFTVTPSNLTVLAATYDSEAGRTTVVAQADPPGIKLSASLQGLSGEAWFKLSTYYVGAVEVSLPAPAVELSARPLLVAPSWLLLSVNATVRVGGACPAYPVGYRVPVTVNGTRLGAVSLSCGGAASMGALLNATYGPSARVVLAERTGAVLEVPVPLPTIEVESADWLLLDNGSVVEVGLSVRGPCRYLVMGFEVSNGTLKLRRALGANATKLELDTGFGRLVLAMPPVAVEISAPPIAAAPHPLKLALAVRTAARVNASLELLLNGEPVAKLRVAKEGGEAITSTLEIQPPGPGLYRLVARAWFASASAEVAYVVARELKLAAPTFVLLGRGAEVRVDLVAEPPLRLPVNVTLAGCETASFRVEANSSFKLSYAQPCTARVAASFLNLLAHAEIRWDSLSVAPKRSLGVLRGGFVVPNGTVEFAAYFSNGTPAPARVTVDGLPSARVEKPGGYTLRVRAEYEGQVNESSVTVFAVPEALYQRSLSLLAELGGAPHLKAAVEAAAVSGRWDEVAEFVNAYVVARSRAPLPLSALAEYLARRWALAGDRGALQASEALLLLEPAVYAVLAAAAAYLVVARRGRRCSTSARERPEGGEEPLHGRR